MSSRPSPKLTPNRFDAGLAAMIALLAAVLLWSQWQGGDAALRAVILVGEERQETIDLSVLSAPEERLITAGGYTLRLRLSPDGAEMTEADCPTQDCVHTGRITRSGQSIVCLPARVIVRLEGGGGTDGPDMMIG